MADTKISALTALTSPASGDEFPIVDKSDTTMAATGTTKKITYGSLQTDLDLRYVQLSLFDANTILYATSDNTPVALTVGEATVVGRATGGNIAALSIDTDLTTVSASDDTIPSAKAVKTYADGLDANALHDDESGEINALTEKATPVSADLVVIEDSAASYAKKKVQVGNLPGASSSAQDTAPYHSLSNSVAETTVYSTTILANALNTKGFLRLRFGAKVTNSKGSNGTVTWRIKLGATTFFAPAHAYSSNASNASVFWCEVVIALTGAHNSQVAALTAVHMNNIAANTYSTATSSHAAHNVGTEATNVNATLALTVQMDAASASFSVETIGVLLEGPFSES